MSTGLKLSGVSIMAAVIAGVIVASASPSGEGHAFVVESTPVTLTGTQTTPEVITFEETSYECKVVELHGVMESKETTKIVVTPTYKECSSGLSIDMNGCKYELSGETTKAGDGFTTVFCGPGEDMIVHRQYGMGNNCTYTIGPQNSIDGASFTPMGAGNTKDMLVTTTDTLEATGAPHGPAVCQKLSKTVKFSGKHTLRAENSNGSHTPLILKTL